jgi:predicted transcriptional regulator of viral defense system
MEKALEVKYQKMVELLGDQSTFYVDEVQKIFPEMKKSSLYWNMSKLVDGGYLHRIRNGVYAFNEWKGKKSISLLGSAEKIRDILDETGFDYYISGLDILHKYMQHVPEQYPNIVFIRKESKAEISEVLNENSYKVIEPINLKDIYENNVYAGIEESTVLLYQTENFDDSENGLATIEKAFVDLYYAVTRNEYPLALQELVRIYENLVRLGNIDKKIMISVAAKRSIQYDIRFIAESKFITKHALKFVEILGKDG